MTPRDDVVLSAHRLGVSLPSPGSARGATIRAVDGVDLALRHGEILALVGESGCGKTTLGRTLLGQQRESAGEIRLHGERVSGLAPRAARAARAAVRYVHQDPGAALDPWWSIGATLDEALAVAGVRPREARRRRVEAMVSAVGLDASVLARYPHELSGGQLRRVGLARVLVLEPQIVILDEPTSGLDLSVQATVLALFRELRTRFALTYLFITHDLSVVRLMCDRVAVMYLGRIVETAPTAALFAAPRHPYTRALLASAPRLDADVLPAVPVLAGEPPSAAPAATGCRFAPRCGHAEPRCRATDPGPERVAPDHTCACLRWQELPPESREPPRTAP